MEYNSPKSHLLRISPLPLNICGQFVVFTLLCKMTTHPPSPSLSSSSFNLLPVCGQNDEDDGDVAAAVA